MVECNATIGRITKLSLAERATETNIWYLNVSYFLPFEQLTCLDLSHNHMLGCVENQGFEILWSRLRKLEVLDLSRNYFNDSNIVSSLSGFSSLKSLYLNGNRGTTLNGNVFEILWSRLRKLEVLDLSGNGFNDSIVSSLSGFSSLKSLYLNGNEMGTTLNGNGLWRLNNLELLDLGWNYFNNSIMSSLRGLSSLKDLNLAHNRLSGTIDMEDLNNLVKLKKLDMRDNKITGFRSFKGYLEVLDLSDNGFNNSVFASLNRLSNLRTLNLSENQLAGSVHLEVFANLRNLEELQLSDNNIEEITGPKDKTTLNKLKVLGLAHLDTNDRGTGTVLKSLGALSSLKTVNLGGNILKETNTFQELFNLSTLEELFLDGSILHDYFLRNHVGSFTSLKVLHLNRCDIKGTLPNQGWCDLKNLEELDLSFNELEGTLPPCLANLSSIRALDLSYNQFTGNIASTPIPNLKSIESLSLINNHFQVSLESFANHSSLKVFLANDGNELIDKASSQPWTPKFQLVALNLANCITKNSNANSVNFLYNQFNLRYLDLSSLQFGGAFPNWLFENNTRLEVIYLNNNSFVGPFQLSSHPKPNISLIDISQNKVLGQIPSNIFFIFPNLVLLNISKNSFHGTIPPMGGTKSLEILDFSNNLLSGEIKEQFANTLLQFIILSDNNFSGYIPNLFDLVHLQVLLLDGNHFVGEIPDLSSFGSLIILDISRNSLTGNLSSWIANVSIYLWEISMSDNKFEGSIPLEFCKLHDLRFMDLSRNDLSGSIPPCFSELTNLQHVLLSGNKLGGPIPHAFINSTDLRILDLGGNNFNGIIPNWIGNLSNLTILLLQANNFHGDIPIELCHLKQLNILALFSNNMSGGLHACLSNLSIALDTVSYQGPFFIPDMYSHTNLEEYAFSPNGFRAPTQEVLEFRTKSNSFFYKGYILDHMYGIDLSCNRFSGEIPIEFGKLTNVRSLNLSHNNLIGVIPATFSKLKQLESLDLSYNDLTGRIPPQLIEMNSLAVFTVAHNNLSGTIPTKNQFGTFIESSYEGNLYLCGPPLNKSCDETNVASPTTYGKDDSFMEMTDFWVSFVVAYSVILLSMTIVLYINPYWRQAWFYHIEVRINLCYYFVVDKLE